MGLRSSKNCENGVKKKADSDKKSYNCHKLGHYIRDCNVPNKRPYQGNRNPSHNSNRGRQNNNWNRVHQAIANNNDNDSDLELFLPGLVAKAFLVKE